MEGDVAGFLKDKQVSIVGHFFTTGPGEELEKYLAKRARSLIFISHPFHFSGIDKSSIRSYANDSLISEKYLGSAKGSSSLTFLKDMISTVSYFLRTGKRQDIFIGIGGLNAFSGLILRRLGLAKTVIFYVIDYVPDRFSSAFLNKIYHFIDKQCATKCDWVWNLSKEMEFERQKKGIVTSAPQIVVPIGTNFNSIKRPDFNQIDRFTLAFLGHLLKDRGVQLIIEALAELHKSFPETRLVIIGKGEFKAELERLADRIGTKHRIEFTGEIKSHSEVEQKLAKCGIGIAPYPPASDSFKFYTDPGKVKTYMACGLPVIVTGVPKIAEDIRSRRAGIVIEYSKESLVSGIITLFKNKSLHSEMRDNAINFASEFDWECIFDNAFESVFHSEISKRTDDR